jgi:hypothetical protein
VQQPGQRRVSRLDPVQHRTRPAGCPGGRR